MKGPSALWCLVMNEFKHVLFTERPLISYSGELSPSVKLFKRVVFYSFFLLSFIANGPQCSEVKTYSILLKVTFLKELNKLIQQFWGNLGDLNIFLDEIL